MPRYARIEDGTVVEIASFDSIEDRFHPSLTWVKAGPEVAEGWRHDAARKAFSPPPTPPPAEAVRRRLAALDALRAGKLAAGFRHADGAVYDAGDPARLDIVEIATGIVAGTGLPGGGATFSYRDKAGVGHPFDGPAFLAFAAALRDWVGAVQVAARTHGQAIRAIDDDPGLAKEQKTARIEAHDIARGWPA